MCCIKTSASGCRRRSSATLRLPVKLTEPGKTTEQQLQGIGDILAGTDNTGSLTNITRVYTTAGTYTVRLTVVDTTNLSSTTSQTITVTNPVVQRTVSVSNIRMSIAGTRNFAASAVVSVVNQSGQPVAGATVAASWARRRSKVARNCGVSDDTYRKQRSRVVCVTDLEEMALFMALLEAFEYAYNAATLKSGGH